MEKHEHAGFNSENISFFDKRNSIKQKYLNSSGLKVRLRFKSPTNQLTRMKAASNLSVMELKSSENM